ncbi:MAG: hypothetical protein ABEN55_20695 [Bradymonadaceae bacterium]
MQGRLVVDYEIARRDWQQLEHIDLWLQLRAPTELTMRPEQSYTYTLPIETPSGRRAFPRWLTPESSENVRVCLLATGPTDNLLYGSGYSCTAPIWLPIHETRSETARRPHTFALQYFAGPPYIPYASWVESRVPGFQGPFDQLPAP